MTRKLTFARILHGFSTEDLHRSGLTDCISVPESPCMFDCIIQRKVDSHELRVQIVPHSHLSIDRLRTVYTTLTWNVEEILYVSSVDFSSQL